MCTLTLVFILVPCLPYNNYKIETMIRMTVILKFKMAATHVILIAYNYSWAFYKSIGNAHIRVPTDIILLLYLAAILDFKMAAILGIFYTLWCLVGIRIELVAIQKLSIPRIPVIPLTMKMHIFALPGISFLPLYQYCYYFRLAAILDIKMAAILGIFDTL